MGRTKMVYISEQAHLRLKLIAARRNRPMGQVVEELVEQELADLANPWTSPEGLLLQQHVLAQVSVAAAIADTDILRIDRLRLLFQKVHVSPAV